MSKQPLGMPQQCIEFGLTLVKTYGKDLAIKQIQDNIKSLKVSINLIGKDHLKEKLNLAQQSDFWSQVLKSI